MADRQILAIVVQEAGRLITGLLSLHTAKSLKDETAPHLAVEEEVEAISQEIPDEDKQIQQGVACLPCTNSHLLTCRGLLDEAHRMSHDGLTPDAMERVDQCLGEIAAAERVDLSPASIAKLPKDEQKIARTAAREIRNIRHDLEGLTDPRVLEKAAARTTELQKQVSQEYVKSRLSRMSSADKARFEEKLTERIKQVDEELTESGRQEAENGRG